MGVFTFENEHTSPVAAATLYKALVFDAPTVLPKVDEAVQSIEILEGNGDAGTIKKLTFVEGLCIHIVILIQATSTNFRELPLICDLFFKFQKHIIDFLNY